MDWNLIEGNWNQLKVRIKDEWGQLTDDDLDKIAGKREQLASRLAELRHKRGYGRRGNRRLDGRRGV